MHSQPTLSHATWSSNVCALVEWTLVTSRLAGRLSLGAWCLWVALWPAPAQAQSLLPVPTLTARVMDLTGTMDAPALAAMDAKLAAFEHTQGSQIVVLMLASTQPEDIADYTQRLGDAWKIGRAEVGDGVLIVVAKNDRRVRIATSKALEGALPDVLAKRIIDTSITPAFRQGDFAGGIAAGLDQVMSHIRGEGLPMAAQSANESADDSLQWMDVLIFLVFAVPMVSSVLRSLLGNKLGLIASGVGAAGLAWFITFVWWIALGAGFLAMLVGVFSSSLPSMPAGRGRSASRRSGHHGGWGGGSSSGGWGDGGGFSSGGGGDFGGGGASGDW